MSRWNTMSTFTDVYLSEMLDNFELEDIENYIKIKKGKITDIDEIKLNNAVYERISVDLDQDDVLNDISDSDIADYLENNGYNIYEPGFDPYNDIDEISTIGESLGNFNWYDWINILKIHMTKHRLNKENLREKFEEIIKNL